MKIEGSNCSVGLHHDCSGYIARNDYTGPCPCSCHMTNKIVKTTDAHETETVRIYWRLNGGRLYEHDVSCPVESVRNPERYIDGRDRNRPWRDTEGMSIEAIAQLEESCDLGIAKQSPLWALAVEYARKEWSNLANDIRKARKKGDWPVAYHFGWGMAARNALRAAGFGEDEFRIGNLDNIYVAIIDEAFP